MTQEEWDALDARLRRMEQQWDVIDARLQHIEGRQSALYRLILWPVIAGAILLVFGKGFLMICLIAYAGVLAVDRAMKRGERAREEAACRKFTEEVSDPA